METQSEDDGRDGGRRELLADKGHAGACRMAKAHVPYGEGAKVFAIESNMSHRPAMAPPPSHGHELLPRCGIAKRNREEHRQWRMKFQHSKDQ